MTRHTLLPVFRSSLILLSLPAAALAQDRDATASRASAPTTAPGSSSRRAVPPPEPWLVRGRLTSRYYLRWTGDTSDQDLYETLSLEVGDPKKLPVTGYFLGRFTADLDGIDNSDHSFSSINDTFDHGVDARAYDAYADIHSIEGLPLFRVGRQFISDTPVLVYFDGAHIESQDLGGAKIRLGAYAGLSSHTYESSHSGDWTLGGYAEARPWKGTWARVDWSYFEDETVLGEHEDHLIGGRISQSFSREWQGELQYTRFLDRDRDARARLAYADVEARFNASLMYYQLLSTQRELVLELDPFFEATHEEYPFQQVTGLVSKSFSDHLELEGGLDFRHVLDSADEGEFNRDYQRGHGTVRVTDVAVQGLSVGLTADIWNSSGQQTRTWGFDLAQKLGERWRAEAGSYYSLYKFDLYLNEERDHVRTYYAKMHHDPSKRLSLAGSLDIEDNDLDLYYVFMLEAKWRF